MKLAELGYKIWTRKMDERKPFTKLYPKIHSVFQTIQTIMRYTSASRVVILKTTNGGGIPRLGAKLCSSVLYETFDAPLSAVKPNWQKQELDASYIELMSRMDENGELEVIASELAPGILSNLYAKDGIFKTHIFKIRERKKDYIYLAINYTEAVIPTVNSLDAIRAGVSRLRTLFEEENL